VEQIEMIKLTPPQRNLLPHLQGQNEGKVVTDGVERTITDSYNY